MRWPVSAVLSDEQVTKRSDRYLDLKSEQWVLAEELVKALRPFDVATTYMCYEENTTISSTLPIIHGLVESMKKSSEDCPNVVHFKHDVTSEIKRRWRLDSLDMSSCMVVASMLDPRFKLPKYLDEHQTETVKSIIVERMDSFSTPSSPEDFEVVPPSKKHETAFDLLLGVEEISTSSPLEELGQFLAEKVVSRKTNPLDWWKNNTHRYPRVAKVAREVLAIPATLAPSKKIFSTAGLTVTKLRSCLKPSSVDALVFLNKNLKSLF